MAILAAISKTTDHSSELYAYDISPVEPIVNAAQSVIDSFMPGDDDQEYANPATLSPIDDVKNITATICDATTAYRKNGYQHAEKFFGHVDAGLWVKNCLNSIQFETSRQFNQLAIDTLSQIVEPQIDSTYSLTCRYYVVQPLERGEKLDSDKVVRLLYIFGFGPTRDDVHLVIRQNLADPSDSRFAYVHTSPTKNADLATESGDFAK